jgi:purine-binding chemotaxis protein CheW
VAARAGEFTPEQRAVLETRAVELARVPAERAAQGATLEVVRFQLAHEVYAVESRYVREVLTLTELTPVPCTPPYVLGVVSVRGVVLSVLDLKLFFELPDRGLGEHSKVLFLRSPTMEFGILADAVLGVAHVSRAGLESRLSGLSGVRERYLLGVSGDGVVVLDGEKLLSAEAILVDEHIEAV